MWAPTRGGRSTTCPFHGGYDDRACTANLAVFVRTSLRELEPPA